MCTKEEYGKWRNEVIEQQVQFVQKVVHALRSAQTDYNVPKSKPTVQRGDESRKGNEKPEAEGKHLLCRNLNEPFNR